MKFPLTPRAFGKIVVRKKTEANYGYNAIKLKVPAANTKVTLDFKGLAGIPRLAGTHPIYIARQLYIFKNGERNGLDAQLMKKPVAQLNDEDIVNISAYLGSLAP